ncbi:hypothetical protein UlMin_016548 [Ulmus minor]
MHWKTWEDLCQPKALGGLGFRDLSLFNQALLGKQVWRFLQRPNSLVSQIFKAKYFPSSSIWECDASATSSYVWRSILWGRNLVALGMRWRVGNGSFISIYNSRWLPKSRDFKVVYPRLLPNDTRLWGLGIPPKVKVFWWRVIHNILPTSFNLRAKHVPANPCCGLCGYSVDTTVHTLFLCPFIKPIWNNTDMAQCLQAAKGNYTWDVVIWASSCWSKEKFEVFALYVWQVWNLRNKWTHGGDYRLLGNEFVSVGS